MAISERRLIDKLGIKPGMAVCLLGVDDPELLAEIQSRATVSGTPATGTQVILVAMSAQQDLEQLADLRAALARDGAIWVVWPKGRPPFTEDAIRAAALVIGLVDVKVVRFSATLSALKLVIPRALR